MFGTITDENKKEKFFQKKKTNKKMSDNIDIKKQKLEEEITMLEEEIPVFELDITKPESYTKSWLAFEIFKSFHEREPIVFDANLKIEWLKATSKNEEFLDFLFEHVLKRGIGEKSGASKTLLHVACELKEPEVVEILLKKGMDPNEIDEDNKTPLFYSIEKKDSLSVKFLIDAGAYVVAECLDDDLIELAAEKGDLEIFNLMLEELKKNEEAREEYKFNPVIPGCIFGHLEIVEAAILFGFNFTEFDDDDFTPLHHAATQGHYKICQFLIQKGADVNENIFNWTPLHAACRHGQRRIVELLLENGANPNNIKETNIVSVDDEEILSLLIRFGYKAQKGSNDLKRLSTIF